MDSRGRFDTRALRLGICALEAAHVFAGRYSENAQEGTAHRVRGIETTSVRNLFEPHRRTVNHLLRGFNPHSVDELAGVHLRLFQADARKVPGTHADTIGKLLDTEVIPQVLQHPDLQFAQRLGRHRLPREHVTVLRLATGPNQEHDQKASNTEGYLMP